VKEINHFEQNRPVHLALRDVFFEEAVKQIGCWKTSMGAQPLGIADYEEALFLLRVARQHGRFSVRSDDHSERDEQFARFINLLVGNVKAIISLLKLKSMVESSDGSFTSFLCANHASVALQAEEYQRRANDIMYSIFNTLQLAEEPFQQLKVENAHAASEPELVRYNKARDHYIQQIRKGVHRYRIAPHTRMVGGL
jgi:hypothetical protein